MSDDSALWLFYITIKSIPMKRKSNNLDRLLVFFLTLTLLTTSCQNDVDDHLPSIISVSPERGEPGDVITITGSRFGSDPSRVRVQFYTESATPAVAEATNIISITDTQIEVEAPRGYSAAMTQIRVLVSDMPSNTITFLYNDTTPSQLDSITPTTFYNATITIKGKYFGLVPEDHIVNFGHIDVRPFRVTDSTLTFFAPNLEGATGVDVTVTKYGKFVSNIKRIEVEPDQNTIATYIWDINEVKPGVVHRTGTFTVFGATRRINVLDVTLNENNTLGIGVSASNDPTTFRSTVAICNDYGAVAGINAGYFDMPGVTPKDPYIRINGAEVQAGTTGNVSWYFVNASLLIHNNMALVRRNEERDGILNLNLSAAAIPVSAAQNIIVCGPLLLSNHLIEDLSMGSHNTSLAARTGLGVASSRRVIMVTVDAGNGSTGVTTLQLAKILQALGSQHAMNFDGGGSTTMYAQGLGNNGLVNQPSGGVQRNVRSVIYVK